MRHHLAILYRRYLDDIIAGRKTVECRVGRPGFPPHDRLAVGDMIWLKEVSGPVRAAVSVVRVECAAIENRAAADRLRRQWNCRVMAPAEFWEARGPGRVATMIELGDLCRFEPFWIEKADRRAWVLLKGPPVPGERLASADC